MDKASLYIRKIIALIIVFTSAALSYKYISWYYLLPLSFFIFSFLYSRFSGHKPSYLFGLNASDRYLTEKGGFWLLLKWILNLAGLVYDIIAITLNGVYLLFSILIDILLLIKNIIYWIIHSIIWFLKLFAPPFVFIYSIFLHYIIRWPWWIYKLAFKNTGISINKNFYNVSYRGAFLSILILLSFYGTGIILGIPALGILGLVFSTLPLAWVFGTISEIRYKNLSEADIKLRDISAIAGINSVKAIVFYLSLFLIFVLSEIILNILGWIPYAGFSLLGISLNVNTFLSLLALFLMVILIFANLILPAHVVIDREQKQGFSESITFLGIIGRRFLKYIFSLIPASVFSFFLLIIPFLIVAISVFLTINLRDRVIDAKIDRLKAKSTVSATIEKADIDKNIRLLNYYKSFPQNTLKEFEGIKELIFRKEHLKVNVNKAEESLMELETEYHSVTDSLKKRADILKASFSDNIPEFEIERIEKVIASNTSNFNSWRFEKAAQIAENRSEINYYRQIIIQLPLVFLLTVIWCAIFGGLILAVLFSYLANVFYALYNFGEDGRVSHFTHISRELQNKDPNQPLLGFTLLALAIAIAFLIFLL